MNKIKQICNTVRSKLCVDTCLALGCDKKVMYKCNTCNVLICNWHRLTDHCWGCDIDKYAPSSRLTARVEDYLLRAERVQALANEVGKAEGLERELERMADKVQIDSRMDAQDLIQQVELSAPM